MRPTTTALVGSSPFLLALALSSWLRWADAGPLGWPLELGYWLQVFLTGSALGWSVRAERRLQGRERDAARLALEWEAGRRAGLAEARSRRAAGDPAKN